jgi:hypothetical protein
MEQMNNQIILRMVQDNMKVSKKVKALNQLVMFIQIDFYLKFKIYFNLRKKKM